MADLFLTGTSPSRIAPSDLSVLDGLAVAFKSHISIYSSVVTEYANLLIGRDGEGRFAWGDFPIDTREAALNFVLDAARNAERLYFRERPELGPGGSAHNDFVRCLTTTQRELGNGNINLLPEQYAMSAYEARALASFADRLRSDHETGGKVQDILLAAFETRFGSHMTSGVETLGRVTSSGGLDTFAQKWACEFNGRNSLSWHYTLVGIGCGLVVQDLSQMPQPPTPSGRPAPLRLIDVGVGKGQTLALSALGAIEGLSRVKRGSKLLITGCEPRVSFVRDLHATFFPELCTVVGYGTQNDILAKRAPDAFEDPIIRIAGPHRGTFDIVTAGHTFHAYTRSERAQILESLRSRGAPVALVLGDFNSNSSPRHRRALDFFDHGLLDPANIGLVDDLKTMGFYVFRISAALRPPDMSAEFAAHFETQEDNDGLIVVATNSSAVADWIKARWSQRPQGITTQGDFETPELDDEPLASSEDTAPYCGARLGVKATSWIDFAQVHNQDGDLNIETIRLFALSTYIVVEAADLPNVVAVSDSVRNGNESNKGLELTLCIQECAWRVKAAGLKDQASEIFNILGLIEKVSITHTETFDIDSWQMIARALTPEAVSKILGDVIKRWLEMVDEVNKTYPSDPFIEHHSVGHTIADHVFHEVRNALGLIELDNLSTYLS